MREATASMTAGIESDEETYIKESVDVAERYKNATYRSTELSEPPLDPPAFPLVLTFSRRRE